MKNYLIYFTAIGVMLAAQYALANPSSQVDFVPEKNPLTVNTDVTFNDRGEQVLVEGPWYKFSYTMRNNSPYVLKVQTFKFTVTGMKNGQITTALYQFPLETEIVCAATSDCETYKDIYVEALPLDDDFVMDVLVDVDGMFENPSDGKAVSFYRGSGTQQTR